MFIFSRFILLNESSYLITKGMSADNNWLFPTWHKQWNSFAYDRFTENCTAQNVSDCSVGTKPHFFQIELFDSFLIGCDGGTFNTNIVLFDGLCRIYGHLIIGLITIWQTQVVILDFQVQVRQDEHFFDFGPNDASHFVTIQIDNWVGDFDAWSGAILTKSEYENFSKIKWNECVRVWMLTISLECQFWQTKQVAFTN